MRMPTSGSMFPSLISIDGPAIETSVPRSWNKIGSEYVVNFLQLLAVSSNIA